MGFFERDPATLEGHWDAQMYRIFGLPVRRPPVRPRRTTTRRPFCCCPRIAARAGCETKHVRERMPTASVCGGPTAACVRSRSRWRSFTTTRAGRARIVGVDIDETDEIGRAARRQAARGPGRDAAAGQRRRLAARPGERPDLARRARLPADRPSSRGRGVPLDEVRRRSIRTTSSGPPSAEQTLRTGEPSDVAIPFAPGRRRLAARCCRGACCCDPGRRAGGVHRRAARRDRACREGAAGAAVRAAAWRRRPRAARIGLWSASGATRSRPGTGARSSCSARSGRTALPLADWLRRCVHPDDRDRVGAEVLRWARGGAGAIDVGCRVVRPLDGSVRWLVMRGGVTTGDASGAPRHFEGVVIDVTEQEQTLQRLRDAARARRAGLLGGRPPGSGVRSRRRERPLGRQHVPGCAVDGPGRGVTAEEIASYVHPQDRDVVIARQRARLAAAPGARRSASDGPTAACTGSLPGRRRCSTVPAGGAPRRPELGRDRVPPGRGGDARAPARGRREPGPSPDFMARISHELQRR